MTDSRPEDWTRLQRIQYLLDQWDVIYDVDAWRKGGGDTSGLAMLPAAANHPSVIELGRCLHLLEAQREKQFRHLKAYRCGAEWTQKPAKIRVKLPSGRFDTIDSYRRVRKPGSWVKMHEVRAAELFLSEKFVGQVFIPDELWESASTWEMAA